VCGRFVASRPVEEIVEQFGVDDTSIPPELWPGPRFNVAPQDEVLAVRAAPWHESPDGAGGARLGRRLEWHRWGLVPSWAKDPALGARAFNARAESLAQRPMFAAALARRRCIVPADAFYEWQKLPVGEGGLAELPAAARVGRRRRGRTQPWCFRAADGSLLGFAGLYEVWRASPEAEWLVTCTIITTGANEIVAPVHDRMPVILRPEDYATWLGPGELDEGDLRALLAPAPDGLLVGYRVRPEVGNSRSEGPQLAEPLEDGA
jgi:putative SOS response-associated peptidase YedK